MTLISKLLPTRMPMTVRTHYACALFTFMLTVQNVPANLIVTCPLCSSKMKNSLINAHLNNNCASSSGASDPKWKALGFAGGSRCVAYLLFPSLYMLNERCGTALARASLCQRR